MKYGIYLILILPTYSLFTGGSSSKNFKRIGTHQPTIQKDEKTEKLIYAIQNENIKDVKKFLDEGADPNKMDFDIFLPLEMALENQKILVLLLQYGTLLDLKNRTQCLQEKILTNTNAIKTFILNPTQKKSPLALIESEKRTITFLLCLKRHYPKLPMDIRNLLVFHLMPDEIFLPKHLKCYLRSNPLALEACAPNYPIPFLLSAIKDLPEELNHKAKIKIYMLDNAKKTFTGAPLKCATKEIKQLINTNYEPSRESLINKYLNLNNSSANNL